MSNNSSASYAPTSTLAYAYKQLVQAYNDYIYFEDNNDPTTLRSEIPKYKASAEQTLTDIQIAYTQNIPLDNESIKSIIEKRLPEDLLEERGEPFQTSLQLKAPLKPEQRKALNSIISTASKRTESAISYNKSEHCLEISTPNGDHFSALHNLGNEVRDHFAEGKSYRGKKATDLVTAHFDDQYSFSSVQAIRAQKSRTQKSRVLTHETVNLYNVDGVDLHILSEHLLSMPKNGEFPFTALGQHHGFAKAIIGDDGLSCIQLQRPVWNKLPQHDKETENALFNAVIKKTAQHLNDNPRTTITADVVREITSQAHQEIHHPTAPERIEIKREYLSPDDVKEIANDDLFTHITGLLSGWSSRLSFKEISDTLNIDHTCAESASALGVKLGTLFDEGTIASDGQSYGIPQPFKGKVQLKVYEPTKEGFQIFAEPIEWNEELYGSTPRIILSDAKVLKHNIRDDDILNATLSYDAGTLHKLSVKSVSPAPILTVEASEVLPDAKNILEEKNHIIAGVVVKEDGTLKFRASFEGVGPYSIPDQSLVKAGEIITAKVSETQPNIEKILSSEGSINDSDGFLKLSIAEAGLSTQFPKDILDGVPLTVPEPSEHRVDMRDVPFMTIDPASARDFDDAIHVEENENGWTAKVAIADVSYYIDPESNLYKEAFNRGTSTYLPDRVIPMLPEELSNNLCSLRPNEDRAAMVTTIEINKEGDIVSHTFERALIRSQARLEYNQVQDAIDGKPSEAIEPIFESLIKPALGIYAAMHKSRDKRGALTLNTREQRIAKDGEGEIHMQIDEQNESHGIIEELMIASNRCAIQSLIDAEITLLARVHGLPNKQTLKQSATKLQSLGIEMPDESLDAKIQMHNILSQVRLIDNIDKQEEITNIIIRSQARARYSSDLSGHFALQLMADLNKKYDAYTHQTSPIRRLIDLHVHYLINEAEDLGDAHRLPEKMKTNIASVAQQASETERQANEIQRQEEQRTKAEWISGKLGTVFRANVTRTTKLGVYFRLSNEPIEGFLSKSAMPDLGKTEEGNQRSYKRQQSLDVTPVQANPITGMIQFRVA